MSSIVGSVWQEERLAGGKNGGRQFFTLFFRADNILFMMAQRWRRGVFVFLQLMKKRASERANERGVGVSLFLSH